MFYSLFYHSGLCDEKTEIGTFWDNWKDWRKTQQQKIKQGEMLDGLRKRLKFGWVIDTLKASRNRDEWKVVIAYAKEQST